jgi:hypothetical protein
LPPRVIIVAKISADGLPFASYSGDSIAQNIAIKPNKDVASYAALSPTKLKEGLKEAIKFNYKPSQLVKSYDGKSE